MVVLILEHTRIQMALGFAEVLTLGLTRIQMVLGSLAVPIPVHTKTQTVLGFVRSASNKALQPTANPLRGLSAAELGRYTLGS